MYMFEYPYQQMAFEQSQFGGFSVLCVLCVESISSVSHRDNTHVIYELHIFPLRSIRVQNTLIIRFQFNPSQPIHPLIRETRRTTCQTKRTNRRRQSPRRIWTICWTVSIFFGHTRFGPISVLMFII